MFVKLLAPGIHRNSALRARDGEGASTTQPSVTMRVPTIDDITVHKLVTQVFGGYGSKRLLRTNDGHPGSEIATLKWLDKEFTGDEFPCQVTPEGVQRSMHLPSLIVVKNESKVDHRQFTNNAIAR